MQTLRLASLIHLPLLSGHKQRQSKMKKTMNLLRTHTTLAFLLLLFGTSTLLKTALAQEGSNFNIPHRLFAVTVPGVKAGVGRIDIPMKTGKGKARPIANSDQWRIYGGTVLSSAPRSTKPIVVELYGTASTGRKLITRVLVRYYQTEKGIQPLYQLNQEPLMIKTPSGWKPLFDSVDSPEILGVMNRELPNSAGYRPTIDFKVFNKAKISIDSWNVLKQQ